MLSDHLPLVVILYAQSCSVIIYHSLSSCITTMFSDHLPLFVILSRSVRTNGYRSAAAMDTAIAMAAAATDKWLP